MGFTLLGPSGRQPARAFARHPPARFRSAQPQGPGPPASRSFDRLSPGSARQPKLGRAEQPLRGFRTGTIPNTRTLPDPGYGFTFRRVAHHCRPAVGLWVRLRSTGAAGHRTEVPNVRDLNDVRLPYRGFGAAACRAGIVCAPQASSRNSLLVQSSWLAEVLPVLA
jgi:hypothetical protein